MLCIFFYASFFLFLMLHIKNRKKVFNDLLYSNYIFYFPKTCHFNRTVYTFGTDSVPPVSTGQRSENHYKISPQGDWISEWLCIIVQCSLIFTNSVVWYILGRWRIYFLYIQSPASSQMC